MPPEAARPRIFVGFEGGTRYVAVSDDGRLLIRDRSSSFSWARRDFLDPAGRHYRKYAETFPDGFVVEYVPIARGHKGIEDAIAKHAQQTQPATAVS